MPRQGSGTPVVLEVRPDRSPGQSPAGPGSQNWDTRRHRPSSVPSSQRAPPLLPLGLRTTPLGPPVRDKERLPCLTAPCPHTSPLPAGGGPGGRTLGRCGAAGSPQAAQSVSLPAADICLGRPLVRPSSARASRGPWPCVSGVLIILPPTLLRLHGAAAARRAAPRPCALFGSPGAGCISEGRAYDTDAGPVSAATDRHRTLVRAPHRSISTHPPHGLGPLSGAGSRRGCGEGRPGKGRGRAGRGDPGAGEGRGLFWANPAS